MNISFCYKRAHLCLYPAKTEVQVVIPEFNIIEDQFGYYWLLDLQLPKTSAFSLSLSLSEFQSLYQNFIWFEEFWSIEIY